MYEPQIDDNARKIADSFEQPCWYLTAYATNITIRVETVTAMLRNAKAERILDIGCGDGSISLPFVRDAKHITFLDQSSAMLDIAKARVPRRDGLEERYINSAFQEAALLDESFDLAICVGVLAYVNDLDSFLGKLAALLRRGGFLILECTDDQHLLSSIDRFYKRLTGILKRRPFSTYDHAAEDVIRISRKHGLVLQGTYRYAYNLPLFRRIISDRSMYRAIRRVYGRWPDNHMAWGGNQCIFCLTRA
jgi:ubiquinone/menaquinone biosynthesis C-methylase UbiE